MFEIHAIRKTKFLGIFLYHKSVMKIPVMVCSNGRVGQHSPMIHRSICHRGAVQQASVCPQATIVLEWVIWVSSWLTVAMTLKK